MFSFIWTVQIHKQDLDHLTSDEILNEIKMIKLNLSSGTIYFIALLYL